MSDFSALNTAITGLNAHRRRIDIISQNIANVETPGYHRQITELTSIQSSRSGLFSGPGGTHGGVDTSVSRRWDQILDTNAKQERGRASSLETQANALVNLEANIGSFSSGGLAGRLQQLFNSFDDLANNPKDLAVRNVVLGNAEAVASAINLEGATIDAAHEDAVARAASFVDHLNNLASGIADLDRRIVPGTASGNPSNGLIDQRDRMATELAGLADVIVGYEAHGQIRLSLNGHDLVSDGSWRPVQLASTVDPALAPFGYQRISVQSGDGRNLDIRSGAIHGALTVANDLVPEQRAALDAVGVSIATSVNALHSAGTSLDATTGNNLFDPAGTTALSFAVSADVAGQPLRLAASDGSGPLDNSVALSLARLGTDPTGPSAQHAELLTGLGNRVRLLSNSADTAVLASGRADDVLQSEVGVSLDEELADLVSAQRAYEASARMISAIDGMLDTLINRTGLVGR
jgi:flagellar hook-associated protein 1 FlgK